ncbi:DNA modification methylase [Beijerinckia sp. L45]|uniref:DNA modification methylase n=1 Tax=Beijerinckia sp. L45 TaxID=1641855 RepID=UPI00131EB91C|nr:DNA modification methylase [Beijerinckia sp. L45]
MLFLEKNVPVIVRRMQLRRAVPIEPAETPALANTRVEREPLAIIYQSIEALKRAGCSLRKSDKRKVDHLVCSYERFGFLGALLVTKTGELIDGELRLEAYRLLKIESVPTIILDGFSDAEIKTIRVAVNRLGEGREWDPIALAALFEDLFEVDPTLLEFTGFSLAEIDVCLSDFAPNLEDDVVPASKGPPVTRAGDLWVFAGRHKLFCGSARDPLSYKALLGNEEVQMCLTDPPYGCRIKGHVSRTHGEFIEGSEMSEVDTLCFFREFLTAMTPHLNSGAIVDIFIDGPGMFPLLQTIRDIGLVQKALVTWDKGAGGMGSLYRQQAEFVLVSKWGSAQHINNIQLGKHGRNRTTVWSAPGLAQFGKGRKEALKVHPTVKPVGLLVDALLDTSHSGGVVLDPFVGSGSTLLAAHRTHRLGRAIELDPTYVDVAVARMERATGVPAIHAASGLTFAALAERRKREERSSARKAIAVPVRA